MPIATQSAASPSASVASVSGWWARRMRRVGLQHASAFLLFLYVRLMFCTSSAKSQAIVLNVREHQVAAANPTDSIRIALSRSIR